MHRLVLGGIVALALGACGADTVRLDEMICQSSSRINESFIIKVDRARFLTESEKLGDLVADEGASDEIAGPALAVHLAAPETFDGDEKFNRTLDSVQALNAACIDASL